MFLDKLKKNIRAEMKCWAKIKDKILPVLFMNIYLKEMKNLKTQLIKNCKTLTIKIIDV